MRPCSLWACDVTACMHALNCIKLQLLDCLFLPSSRPPLDPLQVLSVRRFGRGTATPRFGHQPIGSSTYSKVVVTLLVAIGCSAFVNWRYLRDEYGINVPFFTWMYTHRKYGVGTKAGMGQ